MSYAQTPPGVLADPSHPASIHAQTVREIVGPALVIVMGVSGCGKSSVGTSLAEKLGVPFIDGDDLHPKANVEKMSRGEPLNDHDRLPWLEIIRNVSTNVTTMQSQTHLLKPSADKEKEGQARQDGNPYPSVPQLDPPASLGPSETLSTPHHVHPSGREFDPDLLKIIHNPPPEVRPQLKKPTVVVACSALKKFYRDILRGERQHVIGGSDTGVEGDILETNVDQLRKNEHEGIKCYFVYCGFFKLGLSSFPDVRQSLTWFFTRTTNNKTKVKVPEKVLFKRMETRKNHFMKPQMLRSQLDTLEEPTSKEEMRKGVVVVDEGKGVDDMEEEGELMSFEEVIRVAEEGVKGLING